MTSDELPISAFIIEIVAKLATKMVVETPGRLRRRGETPTLKLLATSGIRHREPSNEPVPPSDKQKYT